MVEELTDWHAITGHPIYGLVFSQMGMLLAVDAPRLADLLSTNDSRAVPQNQRPSMAAGLAGDDQIPARLLITSWVLATGRTLRAAVLPQLRTEEQLTRFWVDKQAAVGRVVATGPTSPRGAR